MIDLSQEFHPYPKVYKAKKMPKPIAKIGKKGNQWIKDRAKLVKEAVAEGIISLVNGSVVGICMDCGHSHPLDPDHRLKRSQGGSNDKSNIDWICNVLPCMCHDKRDNLGDPLNKKEHRSY